MIYMTCTYIHVCTLLGAVLYFFLLLYVCAPVQYCTTLYCRQYRCTGGTDVMYCMYVVHVVFMCVQVHTHLFIV